MNQSFDQGIEPIRWRDGQLSLLDQRLLPQQEKYLAIDSLDQAIDAIADMVVRGAPAIGITAAYAVVLGARHCLQESPSAWRDKLELDLQRLSQARPTAVNLSWAVGRMREVLTASSDQDVIEQLSDTASEIHSKDIQDNREMGKYGAALLSPDTSVLTHCNAGALATGGYGTALGVIRAAAAQGKLATVFADETRPWLQGARLTAWELTRDGIPVTLITEASAPSLMRQGKVQWVIVGADRITARGDVVNKIGTYALAVAAKHHAVGFMVVAPTSTIDMAVESGDDVPIENRSPDEVLCLAGSRLAAAGASALNPVFDVTPAEMVDALVTERGVLRPPNGEAIRSLMQQ